MPPAHVVNTLGHIIASIFILQSYNLLTLLFGGTPYLHPVLGLLPKLINHSVIASLVLWSVFGLFVYLLYIDSLYVR